MQNELDAAAPPVPIFLLGVNAIGAESGNPAMTVGRDIPWLQDTLEQDVWNTWPEVDNWDVFVLDGCNHVYTVYPVSLYNLSVQANYDELKSILLAASAAQAH
jgi:hypothetical protein